MFKAGMKNRKMISDTTWFVYIEYSLPTIVMFKQNKQNKIPERFRGKKRGH